MKTRREFLKLMGKGSLLAAAFSVLPVVPVFGGTKPRPRPKPPKPKKLGYRTEYSFQMWDDDK